MNFKSKTNYKKQELVTITGQSVGHIFRADLDSDVIVASTNDKLHIWSQGNSVSYSETPINNVAGLKLYKDNLLIAGNGLNLCEKYSGSVIQTYNSFLNTGCAISDLYIVGSKNE